VPEGVEDTERGVAALTGALLRFPLEHTFQAVGRTSGAAGARDGFVRLVVDAVRNHTSAPVAEGAVSVSERMGGKFTSVSVTQRVTSAEEISGVLQTLKGLPEVLMNW
ncbi:unnamed protein product, partial [Prorocentrum cordatum]